MSFLMTPEGLRLRYSERGAGPDAVVLVHGWKGSHRLWDKVTVELAERHRVISYDLRGMGESDKPNCRYDFDEMAADLGFLMRELAVSDATLLGWSMGCTVALSYMAADGHGVARVALLNGPLRLTRTADFAHAMTEEQLEGYLRDLARGWPATEHQFQRDTLREPNEPYLALLYGVALQTPLDVALAVVRAQARLDMRDALAALEVPVLAIYADRDTYYPTSLATYIAEHARDGQHVVLTESAHATPLEEPANLAAALERFIASRPARR